MLRLKRTFRNAVVIFFLNFGILTVYFQVTNKGKEVDGSEYTLRPCDHGGKVNQIINIFNVVSTIEEARYFPVQFKSILHHRSSPVFLHVFVFNEVTERIIKTLLFTWQADKVLYKMYRISDREIPSNGVQLLELLGRFLPQFVSKGIYLNQDVLFWSDVNEWIQRSEMLLGNHHAISDVALCNNSTLCRGTPNIMYVNVAKISASLNQKFHKATIGLLPNHLATFRLFNSKSELFNQSSSNADATLSTISVVKRNDFLNEQYVEDSIYMTIKEVVMAVASGQPKQRYRNSKEEKQYFDNLLSSLHQVVNVSFHIMPSTSIDPKINHLRQSKDKDDCQKFLDIAHLKRRTHLFYYCGLSILKKLHSETNVSKEIDVTLLTVLTLDRFASLEATLSRWSGPAAILIHLTDSEASYQLQKLLGDSKIFRDKKVMERTAIHLVYKRLPFNPINYLRNVVLNNTWTSHVLYIDVDFVVNRDAYNSILTYLKLPKNTTLVGKNKKLFVLPAFESFVNPEKNFPEEKKELLKFLKEETITGYNQKHGWSLGHVQTNYKRWESAEEPYQAIFKDAFEPYVVVPRSLNVYFNENLLERMGDKIAYVRLLHGMGYDFYVLPKDFIIHLPHPKSSGTNLYYTESNMFRCGSVIFERYRNELYKMFPNRKF